MAGLPVLSEEPEFLLADGTIAEDMLVRDLPPGKPFFAERLSDARPLLSGDHILYQASGEGYSLHYRSALVVEVQPQNSTVVLIGNTEHGVEKRSVEFSALTIVYVVHYTYCRYSPGQAIKRAEQRLSWGEKRYHALFNNSHFFVTWTKTGKEYNLDDIIDGVKHESEGKMDEVVHLKPVLTKVPVISLKDIRPGDHLMIADEHLLVESIDSDNKRYSAYTFQGKKIEKQERKWKENGKTARIDYDAETKLLGAEESLQKAESLLQLGTQNEQSSASSSEREDSEVDNGWATSDAFVTMMKTGKRYSLSDRCLFSECNVPVGCTPLIPTVSIFPTEADHIVVKDELGHYHSFLVLQCVTESSLIVTPDNEGKAECVVLDLLQYSEVYRVNYKECLPVAETLERATSTEGIEVLNACKLESDQFVSWAKTGKKLSADISKLREKLQVAQIRPHLREKLLSVEEMQVGDHIIQSYPTHWFHCMVTECNIDPGDPCKFKVVYCLRTSVCEDEVTLDPTDKDIYRIVYAEDLPVQLAIKRARSLVNSRQFHPLARLWFVRWAKTGSDEGIEVDLLTNTAAPMSKSRIYSFAQLNPGDYLVEEESKITTSCHHYLVVEVNSPTECSIVESWNKKITQRSVTYQETSTYYRLNYFTVACRPPQQAITKAESIKDQFSLRPSYSRQCLINFLKTGDASEIAVDKLQDDRLLLRREKVTTATQLLAGDHIERPSTKSAVLKRSTTYHHMMVYEKPQNERKCKVIHFISNEKGQPSVQVTEEDLFESRKYIFRVSYPERLDAQQGLQMSNSLMALGKGSYQSFESDCEYFITKATLGHPIHIQPKEEGSRKSIEYTKSVAKAGSQAMATGIALQATDVTEALALTATRTGARLTQSGFKAALWGISTGTVASVAAGVNVAVESPLYTRNVYKLHRRRAFGAVSEVEYKRGVIQHSFTSANVVVGGTAGAVIGQIAIPVPIIGAIIGGFVGTLAGSGSGSLQGWLASQLVDDDKVITLPVITTFEFADVDFNSS